MTELDRAGNLLGALSLSVADRTTEAVGDAAGQSETAAIARFLDQSLPGRRVMGETPLEQAQDAMWDARIWVQVLYRITTMFHVMHQGLGPKLELTENRAWGEHCRKEALAHAVAPEAIADVIAFLVSDAAAPVSGAILPAYGA